MNLKQAVELATANLSEISDSANLDARLLTCHACNIEQTQLITNPELTLNPKQEQLFSSYLQRRCTGEPLAYITGTKEFWSLEFIVNQHVLVPRPDTELLVELTIEVITNIEAPRILELGTGSGAIAISIAKECSDCLITATDISKLALYVAKKNAEKHKAEITFLQSNWYENLTTDQTNKKYDAIVCNPPYIAKDDTDLEKHVSHHEPNCALISYDNGLRDLEIVIAGAVEHLQPTGFLIVEHGFQQAEQVQQLLNHNRFESIQTHKDLAGLDRATIGRSSKKA